MERGILGVKDKELVQARIHVVQREVVVEDMAELVDLPGDGL